MNTLEKIQLTIKANKNNILKSKKIREGSIISFQNSFSNNPEIIARIKDPSKNTKNKKIFRINCIHKQKGVLFLEDTPETEYGYTCPEHQESKWMLNIKTSKKYINVIKY